MIDYIDEYDKTDPISIERYAQYLIGKTFQELIEKDETRNADELHESEIIQYEGKIIIHVHVPVSAEVHSFKKEIYDRVDDSDVKVTATSQ